MTELKKEIKEAIKSELSPLVIGVRNDLKKVGELLEKIEQAKPPEQIKTEVTNFPEQKDFPKSIEVSNLPEPQKEIQVKGITLLFANLYSKFYTLSSGFHESIMLLGEKIKDQIFRVKVENPTEVKFPDVQKVEIQNHQKQVEAVRILNNKPEEAIPVVLTDKTLRRYYDAINNIASAFELDLSKVEKKLDELKTAIQNITVATTPFDNLWQRETFAGKGFAVATPILAVSSVSEVDFFLIKNPAGSGKLMRLKEFLLSLHETTGSFSTINIWRSPTITADGTPITIFKIKSDQVATSIASAFHTPTISSRGTLVNSIQITGGGSFVRELDLSRYLVAGANLLVSVDASGVNQSHSLQLSWLEV